MGVFNNLIMYDQHVPQNSLASIVSDLATEWSWDEEGTALTFKLRQGVKFHDGQPFTAKDVKCTWDLRMDPAPQKLRINPGKSAYYNLAEVTTNGDWEVTFHLKRPQPAFPMLIAGDAAGIYPGHVWTDDPTDEEHQSQVPQAICELNSGEGINRHLLVNYQKPPFDNPEFRRAMALSIDVFVRLELDKFKRIGADRVSTHVGWRDDQHVPQNTLQSIVADLATGWSWNEDGTELTFRLREGVRWHDGQPFTAKPRLASAIRRAQ